MPGRNAASDNLKSSCDCEREGQAFAFLHTESTQITECFANEAGPRRRLNAPGPIVGLMSICEICNWGETLNSNFESLLMPVLCVFLNDRNCRTGAIQACRFRNLDSSVAMMEPAKDRMRNNVSETLDRACAGRVVASGNSAPLTRDRQRI